MKPHKHAELIKAWADGVEVQYNNCTQGWIDCINPAWHEGNEYRIKPAAPKWPETTMTYCQLEFAYLNEGGATSWNSHAARTLANAAIAHACETGQLVTKEAHDDAVSKAYKDGQGAAYKNASESRNERDMKIAKAAWNLFNQSYSSGFTDQDLSDHIEAIETIIKEATK